MISRVHKFIYQRVIINYGQSKANWSPISLKHRKGIVTAPPATRSDYGKPHELGGPMGNQLQNVEKNHGVPWKTIYKWWVFLSFPHIYVSLYSYGHLPVISTYNPIYRVYNPIYNQL